MSAVQCIFSTTVIAEQGEFYRWKVLNNTNVPDDAFADTYFNKYITENNLPNGTVHYDGVFVTVQRRRIGVLSTFHNIEVDPNSIDKNPNRIVSVLRSYADVCGRLRFVGSGVISSHSSMSKQMNQPSIWVIDLKTNENIRRFDIPNSNCGGYAKVKNEKFDC